MILISIICGLLVIKWSFEIIDNYEADKCRKQIQVHIKPVITDYETFYLIKDYNSFFDKAE